MVLAALWIVGLILGQPWARGLFPLIIDCFWAALWLACAAVLSKELSDYNKLSDGWGGMLWSTSSGDIF
ncbi:hypothetical protein COHA_002376 [Chlorella ohadii]|uniref:Uncharacterized protein n=1 Tax=Chlorella ohadii TaxID=2649997 RepID=A0AAD5DXF9_9CHLO|nr:hypothetical protein COHA_002376 [Chlorella ohadii]